MFERVYNKTHFRKVLNQALEEERLGFKNGGSAKLYTVKKGTQAGTVTEKVPYNQVPKSIRNAAKKYGYTLQKWLDLPFNEKRNVIAKFSSKEKYAKPFEFTIAGKKYNVKIPGLKKSSIAKYQELLKGVEEWKLNPTPQNWARIFRTSSNQQTELSKQLRRYITGKPVQGVKEPGQIAKKVFDLINIKQIIGPQLNELKNYDSKLFANLRTSFGATQAASDKQLITSAKEIKKINTQFKKNPEINLEDLTKNIYRSKFTKSSPTEKLKLLTKVSDGVARYLEALEGGRTKFVKIEKPDLKTTKKIVDNIKDNTSGFRFREGTLRNYKFAIRDSLLNLEQNYSRNLRAKVMGSGRVVDEAVGLSATFKDAPGYTEATQFLKEKTNKEKGIKVDRAFKPAFVKALQGDFSDVKSYNKKARDFKKKNPKVDVPIIRIDKNLDVSKVVKHYKNFSPEAQKNIKDIYNKTGVVVQTDSKPLGQLVKEFRRANLLKKGVKATALAGLGLTAAGAAMAGDKLSDATGISKSYLYGESATPQLQTAGPGVETAVGAGATGAAFIPKVRESVGKLTQKIPAPVRKVGGAVLNRVILPAFVGMSAYDLADKSRYETPAEYAATVAQQPLDFLGLGFIADKARENLRMRRYATPEELKQLDQTPGITDYTEIPSQMDKSQLKSSLLERALRKEFGTQGYFDPNARDVFVDTGDEPIEVIPEATKRYMKRKQEGLGAFEDIYGP